MVDDLPKSTFIRRASYIGAPISFGTEKHGDLWPMTWAHDGRLYAGIGDGFGFSQPKRAWVLCQSLTVDPLTNHFEGFDVAPDFFNALGLFGGPMPNMKP